ncbi:hypothetical protein MMG85_10095 [Pseudoxanthomonas sp. LH2527]|uniref:hypothetical protein n=1 Tax=Pseudoxanthomonas sp. LH2527 TaxID=2923249 RepID=UPI001F138EF1|nr:hypothetical protein [Pseudoxanthomonas sp. LH2527]MCH6483915.1 hypothetical protein [Pseudoxanthomonas sp. LH2527]
MRSVFASPITVVLLLAVAIALPAAAQSARPAATPSTGAVSASLYAVNAASLATAMTYCMKTHGPLRVGSRGETCFREARNLLARYGLRTHAERIDQACHDPAQFNTCITPEIGRLVMELNTHFDERRP